MSDELTPLLTASIAFAYVGGFTFVALGVYLSVRRRRLHPLLLVCISAAAISWIEAPYDWAMYAQFPAAIPRMSSIGSAAASRRVSDGRPNRVSMNFKIDVWSYTTCET